MLSEGRLYLITSPYELDGRVSTHPTAMRGYSSMNVYVLIEGDHAILLDTGLPAYADGIVAQLRALLDPAVTISMWLMRIGELHSAANAERIAQSFRVDAIYGALDEPNLWARFRPDPLDRLGSRGSGALEAIPGTVVGTGDLLSVGSGGRRQLQILLAPLRLIPTHWGYDEATRTLFTADVFGYGCRSDPEGPWTIESPDVAAVTGATVSWSLLGSRYWWLRGASTDALRAGLNELFAKYDVETIAPGYGCVLKGRDVVERHVQILDDVLREAGRLPPAYLRGDFKFGPLAEGAHP